MKLPDEKPTTIREAVDQLVASLSEGDKTLIKSAQSVPYHFGAGRMVRNRWGLWNKETPVVQDAIQTYRLSHADDISRLIFEWAFSIVREQKFEPMDEVRRLDEFWMKSCGKTALQAGMPDPSV